MFHAPRIWGGVTTLAEIEGLFKAGFEKVSINTAAMRDPKLVSSAAREFGSQSVIVSIDVRRGFLGGYECYIQGGRVGTKIDPVSAAKLAVENGAGEILLTSMDLDGTMQGYDLRLVRSVADAVPIPVIACGGAGMMSHFRDGHEKGGASAVAGGSYFVFTGKHRAVLVTYPSRSEFKK